MKKFLIILPLLIFYNSYAEDTISPKHTALVEYFNSINIVCYQTLVVHHYISTIKVEDMNYVNKRVVGYYTILGDKILNMECYEGLYIEIYYENGILKKVKRFKIRG